LLYVTDAGSFLVLFQQNWGIVSEDALRRLDTYQNVTPNGPPVLEAWAACDSWRDQKGAEFECTKFSSADSFGGQHR
jgi:hypothetical protein